MTLNYSLQILWWKKCLMLATIKENMKIIPNFGMYFEHFDDKRLMEVKSLRGIPLYRSRLLSELAIIIHLNSFMKNQAVFRILILYWKNRSKWACQSVVPLPLSVLIGWKTWTHFEECLLDVDIHKYILSFLSLF